MAAAFLDLESPDTPVDGVAFMETASDVIYAALLDTSDALTATVSRVGVYDQMKETVL